MTLLFHSLSTLQLYCIDDEPDRLSNRLLEYDPVTNKWTELCPMMYSKYRCSAVVLHNEIYVMGKILSSANLEIKLSFLMHERHVQTMVMMLLHDVGLTSIRISFPK